MTFTIEACATGRHVADADTYENAAYAAGILAGEEDEPMWVIDPDGSVATPNGCLEVWKPNGYELVAVDGKQLFDVTP